MTRWRPWRALRDRPHLRLLFAPLPAHVGKGALLDVAGERTIILDDRLRQRERNAVLGHELIHDERNILYTRDTPSTLIVREESMVNRTLAGRLVPAAELADLVDRIVGLGEGVTVHQVEDEFDVPRDVALLAMWLLTQQRDRGI